MQAIMLGEDKRKPEIKRAGTRILIQITSALAIVFIIAGAICFIVFNYSEGKDISKNKDKLVEYRGTLMCSTNPYVTNMQNQIAFLSTGTDPESLMNDIAMGVDQNVTTRTQEIINDMLTGLVDDHFFNARLAFYVLPPGEGAGDKPVIVMSSDSGTIYKDLPAELSELINMNKSENEPGRMRVDEKNSYMLFPNGVPDFGLDGEYMVSAYIYSPEPSADLWYFTFSSIHNQLAAIDSFYEIERNHINIALILLIAGSILAMLIIMFIVLSYLIRRNITQPIDELEDAAEKVMEGDLDVEVPVYEGEEFEGLKTAFNNMLTSLRTIINMAVKGGNDLHQGKAEHVTGAVTEERGGKKRRRGRSSIFVQITILVIVIMVIAGIIALLLFWDSQKRMAEKSREKIVESMAENVDSGHDYVSGLVNRYFTLRLPEFSSTAGDNELANALLSKKVNPTYTILNDAMKDYPEQGFNGIELVLDVVPETPGFFDKPIIALSSDDNLLFEDLPEELIELHDMPASQNSAYRARLNENSTYMLAEDGLPYFGLRGEYLVISYNHRFSAGGNSYIFWFFNIRPMGEQLAEIKSFYNEQTRNTMLLMGFLILVGVIGVIIETYFGLGYLIRTKITRPIDELETIAGKVMEGNLDVEITVTRGEEFEALKTAFNEMIKSLRDIMDKSTE